MRPTMRCTILYAAGLGAISSVVMGRRTLYAASPSSAFCSRRFLMRNLRLQKADDGEAAYKVLRPMTTLDMAPNPAAYKIVQRIVGRINPKINQVDLEQIIDSSFIRNLETSGFLPELRKKVK